MLTNNQHGFRVEAPVLAEESVGPFTSSIDKALAASQWAPPYRPGQKFDLEPTKDFLVRQAHVLELHLWHGFVAWEIAWIMCEQYPLMDEEAVQTILDNQ